MFLSFHHKIFILLVFCWINKPDSRTLFAQPFELSFNHVDQTDGLLSESYNYFISQDSRGFIWIGSHQGLNRLNGTEVKQYKNSEDDPFSLPEIILQSRMYEDEHTDLWFSSYHYLCKYVRIKDHFVIKRLYYNEKELTGEHRVFFYEKATHSLWIQIENKIYVYNTETDKTEILPFKIISKFLTVDTTEKGIVKRIYGSPWMYPGFEVISKNIDGSFTNAIYGEETKIEDSIYVKQIVSQNDTIAWLFSDKGLIKFNRLYPERRTYFPSLPMNLCDGQLIDSSQIILSTRQDGLLLFDFQNRQVIDSWQSASNAPHSLNSNALHQLFLDRQQILWLNTKENGINYTQLTKQKFQSLKDLETKGLSFSSITYFRHQIWCVESFHGIYVLMRI